MVPMTLEASGNLTTLTEAFNWVVQGFTQFASSMLSTPLFLIPVGIFAAGACIGLVKRLV